MAEGSGPPNNIQYEGRSFVLDTSYQGQILRYICVNHSVNDINCEAKVWRMDSGLILKIKGHTERCTASVSDPGTQSTRNNAPGTVAQHQQPENINSGGGGRGGGGAIHRFRRGEPPIPRSLSALGNILDSYEPIQGQYLGVIRARDYSYAYMFGSHSLMIVLSNEREIFLDFDYRQVKTIFVRRTPSNKSSKTMFKKTLFSKPSDICTKKPSDNIAKAKICRTISQNSCGNEKCSVNSKKSNEKLRESFCKCQCKSKLFVKPNRMDDDDFKLRKFREKNYFDTHGSCHTLDSHEGSYQQFHLNDRLLPMFNNNILSIPVNDSDNELNTIHYFSKYIITQDKDLKIKSKRSSCPLVEHSLTAKPVVNKYKPSNSLALEFHKA